MAPKDGRLSRRQRVIPIAAAAALVAAGLVVIPMTAAHAAVSCSITYTQSWSNQSQFGANVVINNTGDAVNGWSLVFNFPNSATIQNGWPVAFAQTGSQVTISSNAEWNQQIPSGGSFTAGFNANGQFAQPTSFTFNGVDLRWRSVAAGARGQPDRRPGAGGRHRQLRGPAHAAPTSNVTVTSDGRHRRHQHHRFRWWVADLHTVELADQPRP